MRWLWLNTITEFLRKHRVLSLGLTLISVVGFLIGTIGYFQDRGDAKATTRQVFAVERKIENLLALARANESESDYRELVKEVRSLLNARDLSSRNANAFLKELSDQLDAAIAELANSPDHLPNQASIPATASADANSSPDTFSEATTPRSIEQQPFSREPPAAHAGSRKASATETDISHLGPTEHVKYQTANQRVDSAQFSPSSLDDSTHEQAIAPKSRLTFVPQKGSGPYLASGAGDADQQEKSITAQAECSDHLIESPPESDRTRDSLSKLWDSVHEAGKLTAQEDIDHAYDDVFRRTQTILSDWWRYNSSAPNSPRDSVLNTLTAVEKGDWAKYRSTFEQAATSTLPQDPPAPIHGLFSHIEMSIVSADQQVVRLRLRGIWTPSTVEFPHLAGQSLDFCRDLTLVFAAAPKSGSLFVQPGKWGTYLDFETSGTGWLLSANQVNQIPFDFLKGAVDTLVKQ